MSAFSPPPKAPFVANALCTRGSNASAACPAIVGDMRSRGWAHLAACSQRNMKRNAVRMQPAQIPPDEARITPRAGANASQPQRNLALDEAAGAPWLFTRKHDPLRAGRRAPPRSTWAASRKVQARSLPDVLRQLESNALDGGRHVPVDETQGDRWRGKVAAPPRATHGTEPCSACRWRCSQGPSCARQPHAPPRYNHQSA
jgi:hypothetical protein